MRGPVRPCRLEDGGPGADRARLSSRLPAPAARALASLGSAALPGTAQALAAPAASGFSFSQRTFDKRHRYSGDAASCVSQGSGRSGRERG